jgi:hypothetical protein
MRILLLIVYGGLATYGIWKIPFLRKSGIRPGWLWLLFAGHVLTGWVHNWIAFHYFPQHGDIWNYFSLSFLYRSRLFSDFSLFLSDNSTWTYITHNGIVFIQMLLDEFSGGDMTINTLLFAFPVFLGNVALFRVFRRRFPNDLVASTTVFWLPSVLFWTSCIYREGMLYMLLGFFFFYLDALSIKTNRRRIIYTIVLFLLIAYFRLAVAIVLIPALLLWRAFRQPSPAAPPRRLQIMIAITTILFTLILSLPALRTPLLHVLTTEQSSFQILDGHSRLPLPALDGTLPSLMHTLPAAIRNGFFEPLPGSGGLPIYLAFSLELLFIWLITALAVLRSLSTRRPASASSVSSSSTAAPSPISSPPTPPLSTSPFTPAILLFALAGMLTIGLIVPFAGTIVRYRSIYLPFLLAPALHSLRQLPILKTLNDGLTRLISPATLQ